jgi:enterochelin esterase family protein
MSANAIFRPTFADLRAEIERRTAHAALSEEIDALIDQFLLAGGDTPAPCVEYDGTVTWLYRDAGANSVSVVGDVIGYDPLKTRMARVPGSDLFALTAQLPLDARVAYTFVVDRGDLAEQNDWRIRNRPDPLNPKRMLVTGPIRELSVLEMPNARPVPELDGVEAGEMTSLTYQIVGSADRQIWGRVWVFLPADYDPLERRYPTLYLNDGESYLLSACAPQIIDALLEQGEVAPAIMVFVQRADADRPADDEGLDARALQWLADEVVPWIDARYATSVDPQERVIGGAGANATLALYAALERPDVFGRALAQSPVVRSFAKMAPGLESRNAGRGFGPPQCYIDVGRYEAPARLAGVQALCATLLTGGAAVSYQDFGADQGFLGWRTALPDALRFHFGAPPLPAL